MEADGSKNKPSARKRKPLSDISNLTLNPTIALRKLRSSTLPSSSLCPKSSKPPSNPTSGLAPIAISKCKRNSISKPYDSSAKNTNETVSNNSAQSETSVGSSNVNRDNPPITQPQPSTPPPPVTTSTSSGGKDTEIPLIVYSRKETAERTLRKRMVEAVPLSLLAMEKVNDKGKAVTGSLTCPPLVKTKNKKAISDPSRGPSMEKKRDKGLAVDLSFSLPSPERTSDKEKCNTPLLANPPLDKLKGKRDKLRIAGDVELSKSRTDPLPKPKEKRHYRLSNGDALNHILPKDFIERQRAYFQEVDEFELLEEEVSNDDLDGEE